MNILIIGFGSIGQRHLQNLLKKHPSNNYYVLKKSNHNNILIDCKLISGEINEFYPEVEFVNDIEAISSLDVAFICNNTNEHMFYALKLAKKGVHLFIEKPLSNNIEGYVDLESIVRDKSLVLMVGYQTKFHPVFQKIKKIIKKEKISFVNSRWLTYLPNFHPYEDYKKSYAAQKSLGGGVLLTLTHEIDMLNSLFGDLKLVNSISGNYSCLDIDADDYLLANFKSNNVAISLNLSFSQVKEERVIVINTSDKTVVADFINNTVDVFMLEGEAKKYKFNLKRNELFEKEIDCFFENIVHKKNTINTIKESLITIKLINKML